MDDTARELASLEGALPAGVVLTDPDGLDAYRWDRALDPARWGRAK